MEYSRKVKTRSCHQREPITVGDRWFIAETIQRNEGKREVLVVTRYPDQTWALAGSSIPEHERFEISPKVFITFKDASKQGRLKILIEAKRDVPILDGYPFQHMRPSDNGARAPDSE